MHNQPALLGRRRERRESHEGRGIGMDFDNLYADDTRILTTHFTEGRQGHTIDKVIIHHNDGDLPELDG